MKIHSYKIIITLGVIGTLALRVLPQISAGFVPGLTAVVGYTAVATLIALAAMDYRIGSKTSLGR